MAHAFLIGGERIGEAESTRVVQMGGFELGANGFLYPGENSPDLGRIGVADGIRQRHAVADFRQRRRNAQHIVLGHVALQRAAKRGGHRAFDLHGGMRQRGAAAHFLDHLLWRHAHI